MSLFRAIQQYLSTSTRKEQYIPVLESYLMKATLNDFVDAYDQLSSDNAWTERLRKVFLRKCEQVARETTFLLTIAYPDLETWLKGPASISSVGFEDSYILFDWLGNPIQNGDDDVIIYSVSNDSFEDPYPVQLSLLEGCTLTVQVNLERGIVTIATVNGHRVPLEQLDQYDQQFDLEARLLPNPDYDLFKNIYRELRSKTYTYVGPTVQDLAEELN